MTDDQFEALVRRLEIESKNSPALYRAKVGALAILGHAYLLALVPALLLAVALVAYLAITKHALLLLKFGWIAGLMALAILRSLWVRFEAPAGVEITAREAPQLFGLVAELRQALGAPRVHHVLLSSEFNAGIWQIPMLGIFGWQRNYLVLGLPLLFALSPEQFRAVLAHEFGHLTGNHSRFGGWIYRVRASWYHVLHAFEAQGRGSWLLVPFIRWFAPLFNAYAFALSRAVELEADRAAVEQTGADVAGSALVSIAARAALLEKRFWPGLSREAETSKTLPAGAFDRFCGAVDARSPIPEATRFVNDALAKPAAIDDTHPALHDRLAAMLGDVDATRFEREQRPAVSAAQEYLGTELASGAIRRLEAMWRSQMGQQWVEQHEALSLARTTLKQLEAKARSTALSDADAWQRALLTLELDGESAGEPLVADVLARQPANAHANYVMGRIQLDHQDPAGLERLETAMRIDSFITIPSCNTAAEYLAARDPDAAGRYRQRAAKQTDLMRQAQLERATVSHGDRFEPHGLDEAQLALLQREFGSFNRLAEAYVVRKAVAAFPDRPFFVVAIRRAKPFFEINWEHREDAELVNRVRRADLPLPGSFFVVLVDRFDQSVIRRIKAVPGSLAYSKR